jgi:hypothetical protein
MGMTVGDIVEEISEKTNHNLSPSSIIRKVHNLQREIFRKHKRIMTTSRRDIESGLATYPSPCPFSNIDQVLVDGCEYRPKTLQQNDCTPFYYALDETIGLSPVPDRDIEEGLLIFHYKIPRELSINDMNAEPDLDADYRMLLVWGVCRDITPENGRFRAEYEDLLTDYTVASALPFPDTFRVE